MHNCVLPCVTELSTSPLLFRVSIESFLCWSVFLYSYDTAQPFETMLSDCLL